LVQAWCDSAKDLGEQVISKAERIGPQGVVQLLPRSHDHQNDARSQSGDRRGEVDAGKIADRRTNGVRLESKPNDPGDMQGSFGFWKRLNEREI